MIIIENFVRVIDDYVVFEGRASRSEYWWFILGIVIISFFIGLVTIPLSVFPIVPQIVIGIFILAIITPTASVTVRRLHDIGLGAWWLLGYLPSVVYNVDSFTGVITDPQIKLGVTGVAIICNIVMLVLMVLPSNTGENRYGAEAYR